MTHKVAFRSTLAALVACALAGCEALPQNPVIFGQGTSVGITIGQSPTTQTPEFILGYKDANIAYLPTVAVDGAGNLTDLGGKMKVGSDEFKETYSVLGQFEVNGETDPSKPSIGLGKFFATGNAAVKLAAGFACGVADGRDVTHCHKPAN